MSPYPRSHERRRQTFIDQRFQAWLLCACSIAVTLAWADIAEADHGLSRQAKHAFQRGMAAAKQQRWNDAVQAFNQAVMGDNEHNRGGCLRACPPEVYVNLGLAAAQVGDRLQACGWLAMYLVHAPQAWNAATVHAEFERLSAAADRELETQINRVFQEAVDAARRVNALYLYSVAGEMAAAGDMDMALETAALGIKEDVNEHWKDMPEQEAVLQKKLEATRSDLWRQYAEALAHRKRFEEAKALLAHMTVATDRDGVWSTICIYCEADGDLACARQAMEQVQDEHHRGALRQKLDQHVSQTTPQESPYEEVFGETLMLTMSPARDVAAALQKASQEPTDRVPFWIARVARELQEARWDLQELRQLVAMFKK